MSFLQNLDRDMLWPQSLTPLTEGTSFAFDASPITVKTSGAVQERQAFMRTARADLSVGGDYCAFGLVMNQPRSVRDVFRVKGSIPFSATAANWGFAYPGTATAEITAADPIIFHTGYEVDELVCVPQHPTQPLVMFFMIVPTSLTDFVGVLNVQAMISKPDSYSSAIR